MKKYSATAILFATLLIINTGCRKLNAHFGPLPPAPDLSEFQREPSPINNPPSPYVNTGKKQKNRLYCNDQYKIGNRNLCVNVATLNSAFCAEEAVNIEAICSDEERKEARDIIVNSALMAIARSHDTYNARISQHRSIFDSFADLTTLGTTAASAVVPGAALGAASAALVGSKASIDKNFYNDLSRAALLIDLYKSSDQARNVVISHFGNSYKDYSMATACLDLDNYYRAGIAIRALANTDTTPTNQLTISGPTSVDAAGSIVFEAILNGKKTTAVKWSVNGAEGGNSEVGKIASDGTYTAPAQVSATKGVIVTASSTVDRITTSAVTLLLNKSSH